VEQEELGGTEDEEDVIKENGGIEILKSPDVEEETSTGALESVPGEPIIKRKRRKKERKNRKKYKNCETYETAGVDDAEAFRRIRRHALSTIRTGAPVNKANLTLTRHV